MNVRTLLALVVVACVVLAGCGGAPTDTTPTQTAVAGQTDSATTPTTEPPTADPTTTPGETRTALDGETLAASHRESLTERSFEARFSFAVDLPDGTASIDERVVVDRTAGLALNDRATTLTNANGTRNVTTTRFTDLADGTTYERLSGTGYATVYSDTDGDGTSTRPVNASDVGGSVVGAAASVEWTRVGQETLDGVAVTRYEASGTDSLRPFREETEFGASAFERIDDVESANATLLVGADGVVRGFSLYADGTADGDPVSVALDVRFSNVGSATVDAPAWLDEAKRNT